MSIRREKHFDIALNRNLQTGGIFQGKERYEFTQVYDEALTESRRMSNDRLSSLLELEDVIINLSTVEKSCNTKPQSQGNRNRMQM